MIFLSLLKYIMQHIKHIQRINPNPENRFSQPILKDGLVLEDIMKENETKRKHENKINEFKNLCKCQNIREIRKYIKRNDIINSLNTRELNEDFPINEHRFVKRNGLLNLIHDPNISTSKAPANGYEVHEHEQNEFEPLNALRTASEGETSNIVQAVTLDRTEEQPNLEVLNEKVNKLYDFCMQVQNFLIQQFS